MKTRFIVTATAFALVSSFGIASAAEQGSMSKTSQPSATTEMTKPAISLTTAQQRLAWKDVERSAKAQKTPADFMPTVGVTVPNDLTLKPIPAKLARQVSALKPYDFALLKQELVIVDPSNKHVVDVINHRA